MKRITIIAAILLINTVAFAAKPANIKVFADKAHSTITYGMNHLLHSWTGTSKDVSSVILTDKDKKNISQVAVAVKISSFDSKNANRDSHMMEATDAIKYPNITFSSKSIKQDGNKLDVEGTLSFHGVNKDISFVAEEKKIKNQVEVTGGFDVKMTDFNIERPTLMGVATDDDIKITFDVLY